MKLESIRLKNFKAVKDASIENIPAFCVVVGANGSGKSTLFDVLGFLRDCFSDLGTRLRREPRRAMQQRDVIMKKLKQHLSWLTRDVAVVGMDDYGSFVPDLTIRVV